MRYEYMKTHFLHNFVKRRTSVFLVFLFLSTILYFFPLKGDFVFDDNPMLVNNPHITSFKFIPQMFQSEPFKFAFGGIKSAYYRPLQSLSFALDHVIWGRNPFGYHLTNIILHTLNSLLLFIFLKSLFGSTKSAYFTALLFCVHPLAASEAAYISGRSGLLSAFFLLACLIYFLKYLNTEGYSFMISALFCSVLMLLAKGNVILLPALILLLLLHKRDLSPNRIASFLCFVVIGIVYIYLRKTALSGLGGAGLERILTHPYQILIDFTSVLGNYLFLFLVPVGLHVARSIPAPHFFGIVNTFTILVFSSLLLFSYARRNKNPEFLFGLIWFFIGLSPVLFLMYELWGRGLAMFENWLYISLMGLCLLCYSFFDLANKRLHKNSAYLILTLFIIYFCAITFRSNKIWLNEKTLFAKCIQEEPDNPVFKGNMASLQKNETTYDEALKAFLTLESEGHDSAVCLSNIGEIYYEMGDYDNSIEYFEKAREKQDLTAYAFFIYADAYLKKSDTVSALKILTMIIDTNPEYPYAYSRIGDILMFMNNHKQAIKFYKKAVSLSPQNAEFYFLLGRAFYLSDNYAEALVNMERSVKIKSGFMAPYPFIIEIYKQKNNREKVLANAVQALAIDKNSREIRDLVMSIKNK